MRDSAQKATLMRFIADYNVEHSLDPNWVSPSMAIMKASLSFTDKFSWAIVYSQIHLTHTDNTLILDCVVLVTSIIAG